MAMSDTPICPCDGFEHPATIWNAAGLERVRYRAGDWKSFRRALLRPLPGEEALTDWRPSARGDLALQVVEWWAYVADVLTFYNERGMNGNLLGTAELDAEVRRLVRVLGYRPRPGIGGSAKVAAIASGPKALTLPAGFRLESKPAPGKSPQTFETSEAVTLTHATPVEAEPAGKLAGAGRQLHLEGKVKSIEPGMTLLLAPKLGSIEQAVIYRVQGVKELKDGAGKPYTELTPIGTPVLPDADAAGYRLLASRRTTGLWKYSTTINLVASPLELEGVDRALGAGQAMVLTAPGTALAPVLLRVIGTIEQIWYMNGDGSSPPASPTIPSGAPHTRVYWASSMSVNTTDWDAAATQVGILVDWESAGKLRNAPMATWNGTPTTLVSTAGKPFKVGAGLKVLIEDSEGNGMVATAGVVASAPLLMTVGAIETQPAPVLKPPLKVHQEIVELTRGKRVEREVLGIGNAAVAGQKMKVKKGPVTYLPAGDGVKSTLEVFVAGVRWSEVASFYGQPPQAQVYVTAEDDEGKTTVMFGDGVNGALLPTGAEVTATYRIESGAEAPEAGGLTIIAKPVAGLTEVRHPVAANGGSDPDPREQIRRYAPRSVLTFGRAISADDYEAIAAQAPGVARVRSLFGWNAAEQRGMVMLYVGDTAGAVEGARNALLTSADPNRQVKVMAAKRVLAIMFVAIRVEPDRVMEDVVEGVRAALADPETGLLGQQRTRIGESFYFSQIAHACLGVPGVRSMPAAAFLLERPDPMTGQNIGWPPRLNATEGEYFSIPPQWVLIFPEVAGNV